MRKPKRRVKKVIPQIGDVVEIKFLDHHENNDDAVEYLIFGKVGVITPRAYVIDCWVHADPSEWPRAENKENIHNYAIAKGVITDLTILRKASR
jgi:hypothetical protein